MAEFNLAAELISKLTSSAVAIVLLHRVQGVAGAWVDSVL